MMVLKKILARDCFKSRHLDIFRPALKSVKPLFHGDLSTWLDVTLNARLDD